MRKDEKVGRVTPSPKHMKQRIGGGGGGGREGNRGWREGREGHVQDKTEEILSGS